MKWSKEHKWNKEDTIITLYFYKFGIRHLPVKSEQELAETVIGSTLDSLKMQSSNVAYVITQKGLDCPSKVQKEVVEEYNKFTEKELKDEVLRILSDGDRSVIVTERIKILKEKMVEDKKKDEKKKLDAIFRKMGKDPSKMKFVGSRPLDSNPPIVDEIEEEVEEN